MTISAKHVPRTVTFEIVMEDVDIKILSASIHELNTSKIKVNNRYETAIDFLNTIYELLNPEQDADQQGDNGNTETFQY